MVEIVNRPYAKAFESFATARPEVLCLSADLTSSCEVDGFRDRHPEQFLTLGMAEQNMLSFAGGLAMQDPGRSSIPFGFPLSTAL